MRDASVTPAKAGLFSFLWRHRVYWLVPLVLAAALVLALVLLGEDEGSLKPFLYTVQ